MVIQAFPFYGSREAANRAAYRMASEVDCDPPDDRGIWRDPTPVTEETSMQNLYAFADDNLGDFEWTVEAATEKEAYALAWAALTDEQRDRAASIECVDVVSAYDRATQAALNSADPLAAILALLESN